MKKHSLMLLILFAFKGFSQNPVDNFQALKNEINKIKPDLDFSDKLVFACIWKSTDLESRALNAEAYRVYKIYENAKLKNGEKGTVFISINIDGDNHNREISAGRDGIPNDIIYSESTLIEILRMKYNLISPGNTIVLDKTGVAQFTNLEKDQVFSSIRTLITR